MQAMPGCAPQLWMVFPRGGSLFWFPLLSRTAVLVQAGSEPLSCLGFNLRPNDGISVFRERRRAQIKVLMLFTKIQSSLDRINFIVIVTC